MSPDSYATKTGATDRAFLGSGDVAWATVHDNCVIKYTDGSPDRVIRGIGTFVLVKRDGRWLINHYHVTDPNDMAIIIQSDELQFNTVR